MRLALILLGAFALRLGLSLTYPHFWGVDFGANGETVNYWTGQVGFWNAFSKPPLAPGLLLAPFWLWLGPLVGYKIWASLFAILPIVPVYLLTRKLVNQNAALTIGVFASLDWMWAVMFVEGAHPMLAFALLGMCYWAILELYEWWSWRAALTLGGSLALIPWTNQTTVALAAITLTAFWATLWILTWSQYRKPDWAYGPKLVNLLQVLPVTLIGMAIGALALPWYMQTLPGSDGLSYGGPILYWGWGLNTLQLIVAVPVALFIFKKSNSPGMKALAVVLIILALMAQFLSFDEVIINPLYRARYFMSMAAYPLIAWIAWAYIKPRLSLKASWVAGVGTVIYGICAVVFITYQTSSYATMVTQDTYKALQLTGNSRVASNAFSLSLAVAALNKVHSPSTFTAPPPPAYHESDADLRCVLNWIESCNPVQSARRLNIQYFIADERFPHYGGRVPEGSYGAPENQWEMTSQAPWLDLIYSKGTTKLWMVNDHYASTNNNP